MFVFELRSERFEGHPTLRSPRKIERNAKIDPTWAEEGLIQPLDVVGRHEEDETTMGGDPIHAVEDRREVDLCGTFPINKQRINILKQKKGGWRKTLEQALEVRGGHRGIDRQFGDVVMEVRANTVELLPLPGAP